MVDKTRDDLIDDLSPEELKVEKAKLKKEGDLEHLKQVNEEQFKDTQEAAVKTDSDEKFKESRNDAMVSEEQSEGLAKGEEADDPYDKEELQPMVEDDSLEPEDAGFMRGYDRDSEKPKKKNPVTDEERL
jgi:predicted Holliday junction resolvase-like endonuclease